MRKSKLKYYAGLFVLSKLKYVPIILVLMSGAPVKEAKSQEMPAQEKDWKVTLGGGGLVMPEYEGSDEYEINALPYLDVDYRDIITLNPFTGLRYHAFKEQGLTMGFGLGYDWGRDEDDNSHLDGLGDVDGSIEGQLFAMYEIGKTKFDLAFYNDLSDGHDGYRVKAGAGHTFVLPQYEAVIRPGISTTYASDNYMDSYFGVSQSQSARSGLSGYDADAGFKDVTIGTFASMPIFAPNWSLNGYVHYSHLLEEAADSPIVKDDNQFVGGAFVGYTF